MTLQYREQGKSFSQIWFPPQSISPLAGVSKTENVTSFLKMISSEQAYWLSLEALNLPWESSSLEVCYNTLW